MRFLSIILTFSLFISCNKDDPSTPVLNFISTPPETASHSRNFRYIIEVEAKEGDEIDVSVAGPPWVSFDESTNVISGIPGWDYLNTTVNFNIIATNQSKTVEQNFDVRITIGEIECSSEFGNPESSKYILPYNVDQSYELSQSYCPSNPNWGHHNWFAYDFDMPIGTEIIAMRGGEVIAVQESFQDATRVCGEENFVFILHDDNTVASYVHHTTDGVSVEVGDIVAQGDLLGYSGDSGCSIGPHLHIAVFRQRGPYDRQYTLPINFRNAEGNLNSKNGLVQDISYVALPF